MTDRLQELAGSGRTFAIAIAIAIAFADLDSLKDEAAPAVHRIRDEWVVSGGALLGWS